MSPDTSSRFETLRAGLNPWARGLLLVWLLYMVCAGVFLNSPLAGWAINRFPERFTLNWTAAVSLYPGHVWAWGVDVRGHVRHVQWQARASSARGRLALLPLLKRELRWPGIRADEVRFDAQHVAEEMKPRPPSDRAWTLALPHIRTHSLQRARWDSLVLDGQSQVSFGMLKRLRGGPLTVFPSSLTTTGARVQFGEHTMLDELDAQIQFALPEHVPVDYPGLDRLQLLDARVSLDGRTIRLRIRPDAPASDIFDMQPGDGRLQADVSLRRGEWLPGSRIDLQLPVLAEYADGHAQQNRLQFDLSLDQDLRLRAVLPPLRDGSLMLDADLRIEQRRFDMQRWRGLLPRSSGRLALRWRFDSLRWLSESLVRGDWLVFDGHGEFEADLRIEQGRLQSGSRFEVPQATLMAQVLGNRFTGETRALGRIEENAGGAHTLIEMTAEHFAIAPVDAADEPYVQGADLDITLSSAGELANFRDEANARLRFDHAKVQDLTRYNRYLPEHAMRFAGGQGSLSGDVSLNAQGQMSKGRFDIQAQGAALRVANLDLQGDVNIAGTLVSADLDEKHVVVDGSRIELARVAFRDRKGVQHRDWWARIELPDAQAEGGSPLKIDGEAHIAMKDVSLLLALFERKKPFPRWAARLIDAGETEVQGQAQVRGKHVVLDRLEAENDRFSLKARLRLAEGQAHGDLLLVWGLLALGVELDAEDRDYRLIRPRTWFEERPDLLPE